MQNIDTAIKKTENEIKVKIESLRYRNKQIVNLNEELNNIDNFSDKVIDTWTLGHSFWEEHTFDITNQIEDENKKNLEDISQQINKLRNDRKVKENTLAEINKLDNFEIDEKQFKIVNYSQIPANSFQKVRAILKSTINSFFPEIQSFKTQTEFLTYQYKQDIYNFGIDPTDTLKNLNSEINALDNKINDLEKSLSLLKNQIKHQLTTLVKVKIQETEKEINQLDNDWNELLKKQGTLQIRKEKTLLVINKELELSKQAIEKEKNDKKFKIMKEKKGRYTFGWKYERKSWQAANSIIYFDSGEDYLFEKISDSVFKKITRQDFLARHLSH